MKENTGPHKVQVKEDRGVVDSAWFYTDARGIDILVGRPDADAFRLRITRGQLAKWIKRTERTHA